MWFSNHEIRSRWIVWLKAAVNWVHFWFSFSFFSPNALFLRLHCLPNMRLGGFWFYHSVFSVTAFNADADRMVAHGLIELNSYTNLLINHHFATLYAHNLCPFLFMDYFVCLATTCKSAFGLPWKCVLFCQFWACDPFFSQTYVLFMICCSNPFWNLEPHELCECVKLKHVTFMITQHSQPKAELELKRRKNVSVNLSMQNSKFDMAYAYEILLCKIYD